ncbi:GTPase family protein [Okeania sp. KiyG1]|uniref:GTPase family protein n=1 Tax=Okeania sp. KiyG1 TaxID=2720165 RepID=UPI0019233481|nr:GTPase [Okeania sp. KiyG1]GGA14669.1 hypothetical protein CYANOKiyG1_28350 [Okeania sp. KiyG1]
MNNEIDQELKKIQEKLKPPSIAIIGRTGAGKSSLIKAIFGLDDDEIAVDVGLPVTKSYRKYPNPYNPDIPIILYDSPGYEVSKTDDFLEDTLKFLGEKSLYNTPSVDDCIHLVWYLIHAGLSRIEYFDKQVIETALSLKIPIIIVLSQCDIAKPKELSELKKKLSYILADIEQRANTQLKIMEVSADPIPGKTVSGLKELTKASIKAIPESYSEAFIRAQTVNVKLKRRVAYSLVATAAGVCFGSAFVPIPGSTPISIIGTQPTLLASLAKIYNLDRLLDKGVATVTLGINALVAIAGTTILDVATTIFSAIFPPLFIPGESITGIVAASYILIIGLAYTSTLEAVSINYLNSNMNREEVTTFFKRRFAYELKRYQKEVQQKSDMKMMKEFIESLKRGDYNPQD